MSWIDKYINRLILVVGLCIAVGLFSRYPKDIFHMRLEQKDFIFSSEKEESFIDAKGNSDATKMFTAPLIPQDKAIYLYPGSYTVTLNFQADDSSTAIFLYSALSVTEDNKPGKVLGSSSGAVLTQNGYMQFPLVLDKPVSGIYPLIGHTEGGFKLDWIEINSNAPIFADMIFYGILTLLILATYFFYWLRTRKYPARWLLLCLFTAAISSLPLWRDFVSYGMDPYQHLVRIDAVASALQIGQFPNRINSIVFNGVGYIDSSFYAEFFLYFPAILRLCGLSMQVAYSMLCTAINILTAILAYRCALRLSRSSMIASVFSILYTLSLYRMVNLYARSALGEFLGMAFLPCVAVGMYIILFDNEKEIKWLVIGFCGMISSHIFTVVMSSLFCFLYCVCFIKRFADKNKIFALLKTGLLLFLLNAWFLVPFVFYYFSLEFTSVYFSPADIIQKSVYPSQLFSWVVNPIGWVYPLDTTIGEMSQSISLILGIGIILFVAYNFFFSTDVSHQQWKHLQQIGFAFLFGGIISAFLTTVLFPWDFIVNIPLVFDVLTSIQFPSRFLGIASVCFCFVTAIAVYQIANGHTHRKQVAVLVSLILAIVFIMPYLDSYVNNGEPVSKYTGWQSVFFDVFHEATTDMARTSQPPVLTPSHDGIKFSRYIKDKTHISFHYIAPPPPPRGLIRCGSKRHYYIIMDT